MSKDRQRNPYGTSFTYNERGSRPLKQSSFQSKRELPGGGCLLVLLGAASFLGSIIYVIAKAQ